MRKLSKRFVSFILKKKINTDAEFVKNIKTRQILFYIRVERRVASVLY